MALLTEVIETRTRLMGVLAYDTLTARYGYWNAMWIAKRYDEAAAGFIALLPDIVQGLKDDSSLAASARLSIARALADAGRPAEAEAYARRAMEQYRTLYGPEAPRTVNMQNLMHRIERDLAATTTPERR
jgi:hypothetical protein